jgi:hypothetical protein
LVLREFAVCQPGGGILEAIEIDAFRDRTYMMMRLARASIIYLSLAVGREEQLRAQKDRGLAMPMTLPTYRARGT